MATEGALCQGKHGRLCVFDAQYLHGVVPGKGPIPTTGDKSKGSTHPNPNPTQGEGASDEGRVSSEEKGDESRRRLTLMVGFWKKIQARPRGTDTPGPAQSLPTAATTKYSWLRDMEIETADGKGVSVRGSDLFTIRHNTMTAAPLVAIDEVWCTIDSGVDKGKGGGNGGLKLDKLKLPSYDAIFQGF